MVMQAAALNKVHMRAMAASPILNRLTRYPPNTMPEEAQGMTTMPVRMDATELVTAKDFWGAHTKQSTSDEWRGGREGGRG